MDPTSTSTMGERAVIEQPANVPVTHHRGDGGTGANAATQDAAYLALARTIHQFHTYPPTSPLCVDAIAACRKALAALGHGNALVFTVPPQGAPNEEPANAVSGAVMIEQELTRRLRRNRVASLKIDRDASARDLSRFCSHLIRCCETGDARPPLAERLAEDGVVTVDLQIALHPEVLAVPAPTPSHAHLIEREHRRREEARGPDVTVEHLYPPNKGWVRLDPAVDYEAVSLTDLAILVDHPTDLANMLTRLTQEPGANGAGHDDAVEQKFSEVATLFAALDPQLARVMFGKLARVVLEMKPDRRQRLLRSTVLPGLLDGDAEGMILQDFPDPDLAESLCLLLDLETAAPEVVATALDRLGLDDERRQAVAPLVEARMRERDAVLPHGEADADLDRYARQLTRIDAAQGKNFAEFAAFDLAVGADTIAAIQGVRDGIVTTDMLLVELDCLLNLVRLQANPEVVEGYLASAVACLGQLADRGRWADIATRVARLSGFAHDIEVRRPEVTAAIALALASFCNRERAVALLALVENAEQSENAGQAIDALGAALAPAFTEILGEASATHQAALLAVLCQRAAAFAPALVAWLGTCPPSARHVVIKILGFAGEGYEAIVAEQLGDRDERARREAFRALARINTPHAASFIASQLRTRDAAIAAIAFETFYRFPAEQTRAHMLSLLSDRDFVSRYPKEALRLIDRLGRTGGSGFEEVLRGLQSLRVRFWRPALVRVARKATEVLAR